ncbi:hypothetical protein D6T65_15750 [Arthrobacter frigidicola]|nr:hypothetical protein D6T65_15750 [Arthrobacter frigidicola]
MNIFRFLSRLPQPLKALYILFIVVFIAGITLVLLRVPDASLWMSGGIGAAGLLLGLCLVVNVNKAAEGLAAAIAREKPMGIDFSTSFMAQPAFARFFGLMFVLVGAGFISSSVIGP